MSMVEVKTSALSGAALDWAVVQAEGHPCGELHDDGYWSGPEYSTDWSQGGPLIEKHRVDLHYAGHAWMAQAGTLSKAWPLACYGGTALIAACRAIVAAHLGDVVQVPAELLEVRHA